MYPDRAPSLSLLPAVSYHGVSLRDGIPGDGEVAAGTLGKRDLYKRGLVSGGERMFAEFDFLVSLCDSIWLFVLVKQAICVFTEIMFDVSMDI